MDFAPSIEISSAADAGVPYMRALSERARVVRDWQRFFEQVPLVLAPVCTQPVDPRGFDVQSVERTAACWRAEITPSTLRR